MSKPLALETLILERHEAVALIRLNRPKALNALNGLLVTELAGIFQDLDQDPSVRVFVVIGSDKAFAAGADIKEMAVRSFADMQMLDPFGRLVAVIEAVKKPIIAAVSGYALGGGCELAMLCDFILAADNAKFGQPEVNLGIAPGMGGSQTLTRLIGRSKAMDMILTARHMAAEEAERAGLVSRIVPLARLEEEAMAAAQTIAKLSPLAIASAKQMVKMAENTSLDAGMAFEKQAFFGLFATEDQKEGMSAFLEKRPANFQGR